MNKEEIEKLKETVISVLKTIYDPEIPVDIWTLHLIYGIDVDEEGNVKILMTVTAPNCPVAEVLPGEVQQRVQAIIEVKKGKRVDAISMNNFIKTYKCPFAYRISGKNFGFANSIKSVPLYAVFCIEAKEAPE